MNPLTLHIDPMGPWQIGLFATTFLCFIVVAKKHFSEIGAIASALWVYVTFHALFLVEFPLFLYGNFNTAFQARAGQSLLEALIIPLAAIMAPKLFWRGIPWLAAVEIVCVWTGEKRGLMGWESFDNALIALCIPFIPHWLKMPAIITILAKHGSTAQLMLGAQFFALSIHRPALRKYLLLCVPGLLYVSHKHQLNPWFDSGHRMDVYKRFMSWWWKSSTWNIWVGTGTGTFLHLSLLIDRYQQPMWLHMHSDILQVMFELGIIGWTLAVGTIVTALRRVWNDQRLLAAVMSIGVFCTTYHPLRFGPSMLLVAIIMVAALKKQKGPHYR